MDTSTTSETEAEAQRLLGVAFSGTRILLPDELSTIAAFLDSQWPQQVCYVGTDRPYVSKDLGIGSVVKLKPTINVVNPLVGDVGSTNPVAINLGESLPVDTNTCAEQFDAATQQEAFEFIKCDSRIELLLRHPRPWIKVQGVRRTFYHFQLYAAFWMLREERGFRRGAIEADLMGLGKVGSRSNAKAIMPSH